MDSPKKKLHERRSIAAGILKGDASFSSRLMVLQSPLVSAFVNNAPTHKIHQKYELKMSVGKKSVLSLMYRCLMSPLIKKCRLSFLLLWKQICSKINDLWTCNYKDFFVYFFSDAASVIHSQMALFIIFAELLLLRSIQNKYI